MKQNYINHIALVIDASASMQGLSRDVVKIADAQIAHLARRSKELDQETRISVYSFNNSTTCLIFDKDVLRMPSLQGLFCTYGMTALIDATNKAIDDLTTTSQLYGDHAFLVYVLTDGGENASLHNSAHLADRIKVLPENWTLAVFVPNQTSKFEAKKFGFPSDNIAIWDTTSSGFAEVGEQIRQATDAYMTARATGVRGSRNIFNLNTAALSKQVVQSALAKLHPGQYRIAEVLRDSAIAPFVEGLLQRPYRLGEAYYQLNKPEKVQAQKAIALYDTKTHAVYTGSSARQLLGLPDYEVKVSPAQHPQYMIFIQSTSVNRKLIAGTKLLILS